MNKSNRLLELDVIRGIAALGVVLFHYTSRYNEIYGHSEELIIYFPYGNYGIELFFIISGLVIFMTLERTKRSSDFMFGRFSRLYPAYWAAVIVTFTIVSVAGLPDREVSFGEALLNLTMFQEFLKVPDVDGVYWTLTLELSFYIIMFILHKAKLLKYINSIVVVWLLLMILAFVLEEYAFLEIPSNINNFLILDYANLFIVGIILYKINKEGFSPKKFAIIAACILAYNLEHSWQEVLLVAAFIVLFYLTIKKQFAFINWMPLIFLGTISYPLYLIHQNIGYVTIRKLYQYNVDPNISVLIAIILVIILSTLITFLVEKPMLDFLRAWYKNRSCKQPPV